MQVESGDDLPEALKAGTLTARELVGKDMFNAVPTGQVLSVHKLLGPLAAEDVPIIRAIGLNYSKHSTSSLSYYPLPWLLVWTDMSS